MIGLLLFVVAAGLIALVYILYLTQNIRDKEAEAEFIKASFQMAKKEIASLKMELQLAANSLRIRDNLLEESQEKREKLEKQVSEYEGDFEEIERMIEKNKKLKEQPSRKRICKHCGKPSAPWLADNCGTGSCFTDLLNSKVSGEKQ